MLQIRAGDGDGELPAEELGAERVRVVDLRRGVLPVGAVGRLARRGDEPLPLLAGGLGDQLLRPQAEAARRLADADLVAALVPAGAELPPELEARVPLVETAVVGHPLRVGEQPVDVDPHQRRRDDAERRQRGVAAADRRLAVEHVAEAALPREPLQVGARIGDGGERGAALSGLLPEVVGVRARLERRAGLRRRDEQRPVEVERRLERADRGGMRRVEHVEAGRVERAPQHLGREARAAHPEQDDGVDPVGGDLLGERGELGHALAHAARLVEPAEPPRLVGAGPRRRVALPDPVDEVGALHAGD